MPPDLTAAASALDAAGAVVATAAGRLAGAGRDGADDHQQFAYDLAHAASALAVARSALGYGEGGPVEAGLAAAFAAEAVAEVAGCLFGREQEWGASAADLAPAAAFVAEHRDPAWLSGLAGARPAAHLDADLEMVAATFRRFARERIAPVAGDIHRRDLDVPEEVISGLAALGAFGLSVPEAYGGSATGTETDLLAMVVATEELSAASLGAGGSLITRPEILTRAILAGGTEEQKQRWLPRLADGSAMAAVAVTEPDHGSDVAGLALAAARGEGWWELTGTKTWSTFAARADLLAVLARTDPDRAVAHRGLSLFVVEKPRGDGRGFVVDQPGGGRLEGRPIPTIGYRGMHSYELAFDRWRVPADDLVGGEAGAGRGFYLQVEAFAAGRLQTAARAVGVMAAAHDAAATYGGSRVVFGRPLGDHQLSRVKLARMAATIAACRAATHDTARLMARSGAGVEAAMLKAYVCRAAEWVTREAMQMHGGAGYAEETAVSRYFVDARVLSIFEGAEEVLALRVIARSLASGS